MIIRSFYDLADRLELSADLTVLGRPAGAGEPLSPGFFAGSAQRHVFVVPTRRGPCLGFDGHLLVIDPSTHLSLREAPEGRMLVVERGGEALAVVPAPEPDDFIDDDAEMNDFFAWLAGRFNRAEARAAYTL